MKGKFSEKIREEYFTSSTPFTAGGEGDEDVLVATLFPYFDNSVQK